MSLSPLFKPNSIAIVGVSHDERKVGYLVAQNLLEQRYKGKIYFVNPKGGTILGYKVFKGLRDIRDPIDLVVLAVPSHTALKVLDDVHACSVHHVVLFAAGFGEIGEGGESKEQELITKCTKYNIKLLGPNCIGYINTHLGVNTTFLKHVSPKGNIGFISQSGALGSILIDYFAGHENLGFSYFFSLGNKTILDESNLLEYLAEDPNTEVIALYLEDVKNGERFRKIVEKITPHKPIILLKSGSTEEGAKAALSHTGSMAGSDEVFDAICTQHGVLRAYEFTEFLTYIRMFSYAKTPASSHILVLSNAGGVGVLMADELVKHDVSLVTISYDIKDRLSGVFGESKKISVRNPIDILGDASAFDYKQAISLTLQEKDIGGVVILLTPQANTQIDATAKIIIEAQQDFEKPIYPIFMGEKSVKHAHTLFERAQMLSFRSYDRLPRVLSRVLWYKDWVQAQSHAVRLYNASQYDRFQKTDIKHILSQARGRKYTNLEESLRLLQHAGIPTGSIRLISSMPELEQVQNDITYPVVAKIASDAITHKTDVKGVVTGISDFNTLRNTVYEMRSTFPDAQGCYIQRMEDGYEVFIGAKRDPQFGPVVLFGLGGIHAELLKEITYLVYPFSYNEFLVRLQKTKLYRLMQGYRGKKAIDSMPLYDIITRLGMIMHACSEVKEVDINPLFLSSDKALVVDARIIL